MTGIHNYSIMWNSFTTPKTFNIGSHRMTLELAPLDHSNLIEIILLTHSVLAILAFFLFLQKVKHIFSCSLLLHWHHLEISLLLYSHNGSLLSFIEAVDAPCSHLLIILPCFFFFNLHNTHYYPEGLYLFNNSLSISLPLHSLIPIRRKDRISFMAHNNIHLHMFT